MGKHKSKDELIFVCPTCGSEDIERLQWVSVNSDYKEDLPDDSDCNRWCEGCESHVGEFITLAEYKEQQENK